MNTLSTYAEQYKSKTLTAAQAVDLVQSGDMITLSGGAMQPFQFLNELSKRRDLRRVTVTTHLSIVPPDLLVRQFVAASRGEVPDRNVRWCSFGVGPGSRQGAVAGVVDVVPITAQNVGILLRERRLDILVVGSSGMDDEGNLNLGCNVDWMPDLLAAADQSDTLVIAEVNRTLPRTEGETTFRLESVDHIIESVRPAVDLPHGSPLPEAQAVGGFLNSLVPDEATLQLGVGELVSQSAAFLDGKRDLGVHSDLICDVMYHLRDRGALTSRKKGFMPGKWVGSYILGSRKLYELANGNPLVSLHPCEWVSQPGNIRRNRRMVSINQAVQVDLTGQVACQTLEYEFTTNPGIQHVFHTSAANSDGGVGIVVLPSASSGGRESNVVTRLPEGAAISIPRSDVDCIVTEQGVARLRGKSVSERVLAMISVAHPSQRDALAHQARRLGML